MKTSRTETVAKRLATLSDLIAKYGHRWSETPSARMVAWVDEYTDLREKHYNDAWQVHCERKGFSADHTAYDCLA